MRLSMPVYPVLATGLTVLAAGQALGQDRAAAATVAGLVSAAAVALAGSQPLTVAVVVAASVAVQALTHSAEPVFASFLALMVAFYALGRRSASRAVVAAAAAFAGAVVVMVVPGGVPFRPVELVFPVVYLGGATAVGRVVRARESAAAAELDAARREAVSRERVALAEERARISREMHDVVAHSVSLLVVQAEAAAALLPTDPASAQVHVERVADSGRQALEELRRLLGVLRADDDVVADVEPQPSFTDLQHLVDTVRAAGRHVSLDVGNGLQDVPAGLQLAAYRVVQEAMTNAVRHGGARRLTVRVQRQDDQLEVEVLDDGRAPVGRPLVGHGLVGMRDRLRVYGGRLDAGPRAEGGWRVLATAPVVAS